MVRNDTLVIGSIVAVVMSVMAYGFLHNVFRIQHSVCYGGWGADRQPFIELQQMKGVAYVFSESRLLEEIDTPYQHVEVHSHPDVGNILVIDGSLQIATLDEHHYHEMMVHVPMAYLPNASKALVVGGGDGGALLRILEYDQIEKVHLIDIDMRTMRDLTYRYFPKLSPAFEDPRVWPLAYDGNQWVKEQLEDDSNIGSFGFVIIDSTDYGSAEPLFTDEFYGNVRRLLDPERGIMVLNLDSPTWNPEIVSNVQKQIGEMFRYSFVYHSNQPTYLGGHFSFLFASDNVHPMRTPIEWSKWTGERRLRSHYYNPEHHFGCFILPRDVSSTLTMTATLKEVPDTSRFRS
eukprot:PhM_4_TR5736/c0_g1_i1/m.39018/K00797/speE, SRM; spermidine synthase